MRNTGQGVAMQNRKKTGQINKHEHSVGSLMLWFALLMGLAVTRPLSVKGGEPAADNNNLETIMDSITGHYNEGLQFLDVGDMAAARKSFESVMESLEGREEADFRRVLSLSANNYGNLLLLEGKPAEAEPYFIKSMKADPSHALAINNLGVAVLQQGRISEAMDFFKRAKTENPDLVDPLKNLAELMLAMGKNRSAGEYAIAGLKLVPDDSRLLLVLAKVYERANMPDRQEKVWETMVNATDGSLDARLGLATFYLKEGVYALAESKLKSILAERPEFPEAQLQMGRLLALTGKTAESRRELIRLLDAHPAYGAARTSLANLALQAGDYDEALTVAQQGAESAPDDAESWFVLGVCHEKREEYDQAEDAYKQVLSIDFRHARALNNLGVLAAREDDVENAVRYLSTAIAFEPLYGEARYNLGRILVVSQKDYELGATLVAGVAETDSDAAPKARKFLSDLARIARGEDPGWTAGSKGLE